MNISNFELFKFSDNDYTTFVNNGVGYNLNKSPYLDIILTDRCNSNCSFCIADLIHKKLDCEVEEFKGKIDFAVDKMNVKEVLLLGGEPTISQSLFPIIEHLKTKGLDKIVLTSNGIRLAHDESFRKKLMSSGVTHLNLSIMTLGASVQSNISNTKKIVSLLHLRAIYDDAMRYGVQVRINCNVFKGNMDTVEAMHEFYTQVQHVCDSVKFSPLFAVDDFSVVSVKTKWVRGHILSPEKTESLFEEFEFSMSVVHGDCMVLENSSQFGFVKNTMITLGTPIIMNWNFGKFTGMKDKVIKESQINNIKLLPNGELSLSWNREEEKYYIKTK